VLAEVAYAEGWMGCEGTLRRFEVGSDEFR